MPKFWNENAVLKDAGMGFYLFLITVLYFLRILYVNTILTSFSLPSFLSSCADVPIPLLFNFIAFYSLAIIVTCLCVHVPHTYTYAYL